MFKPKQIPLRRRVLLSGILVAGLLFVSPCIHITQGSQLHRIVISPAQANMQVDEDQTFNAEGRDLNDDPVPIPSPNWVVNGGGTISPNGTTCTFTATTAGDYEISCYDSSGSGADGSADIHITQGPQLHRIVISPAQANIQVGQSQTFTAQGEDQNGNPITIPDPQWAVNGGGTISPNGTTCTFTTTEAGDYQISCNDLSGVGGLAKIYITLRSRRGAYPFQDKVSVGLNSRRFNTNVNVVTGNPIHQRWELYIHGRGLPFIVVLTYNGFSPEDSPFGNGWQMNYGLRYVVDSQNGNVIVVRADGREDLFIKRADGTFRATQGVRDRLVSLPTGYKLIVWRDRTNNNGDYAVYYFDSPDHPYVTKIEDRNGNSLTFTYNEDKQLTTITDASGRQLAFTYANNKLTKVTDPAGRQWQYQYDPNDDMAQVTNPLGGTTKYSYATDSHKCQSITDARGNTHQLAYDNDGAVTSVTDPLDNNAFVFSYQKDSKSTQVTDGNGNTTVYSYNDKDQVVAITDALGNTSRRTWDDSYNLTSLTNRNGYTTTYTHDSKGNPLTATDPLGNTSTLTWEHTYNKITSVTDKNGNTTTYNHDAKGNVISRTDALGNTTTYTYNDYGQMVSRTDALNNTTNYEYDAFGRLTKIIDALRNETVFAYDASGNMTSWTDANGNITAYTYDALNRLMTETDPLGAVTTFTRDAVGNITSATNANGNTTQYGYDGLNRLVSRTDALGGVTGYGYDGVGNTLSITNANGNTTTYQYDEMNRNTKVTTPLGNIWKFVYDAAGNIIQRTDANGDVTSYNYDALNRCTKTTYPDSEVGWKYDAVDNLLEVNHTGGLNDVTTYHYDPLDRVTSCSVNYGGEIGVKTVTYGYNAVGKRTTMTYSDGETTTQYQYDAAGRLVGVYAFDGTTRFEYDNGGRITRMINPLGWILDYGYNAGDQVVSFRATDSAGQLILDRAYDYDAVGNKTREEHREDGSYRQIQYDALDRLIEVTYGDPTGSETQSYTYDGLGNRQTKAVGQHFTIYTYNGDGILHQEITPPETTTYINDKNGNRTRKIDSKGTDVYEHDFENNLTRLVTSSGDYVCYVLSPWGLPLRREVGTSTWSFPNYLVHDKDNNIIEQLQSPGEGLHDIWFNPNISALVDPGHSNLPVTSVYDPFGTSTIEIQPEHQKTHNFDEFGSNLGESHPMFGLAKWDDLPWDNLNLYQNGWDPTTATYISSQVQWPMPSKPLESKLSPESIPMFSPPDPKSPYQIAVPPSELITPASRSQGQWRSIFETHPTPGTYRITSAPPEPTAHDPHTGWLVVNPIPVGQKSKRRRVEFYMEDIHGGVHSITWAEVEGTTEGIPSRYFNLSESEFETVPTATVPTATDPTPSIYWWLLKRFSAGLL